MADLAAVANVQIGRGRYPTKRRMNLYQRELKKGIIAAQLVLFGMFWVLVYFFVQYGVLRPMWEADQAEAIYRDMQAELEMIKADNTIMDAVQIEYAHYGSSCLTEEERAVPSREDVFDTLKMRVFPLCQSISAVNISGDRMDINCVLPRGTILTHLVQEIEEDERVRYVSVSLEATPGKVDDEAEALNLAMNKEVNATLAVYFNLPEESEPQS